MHGAWDVYGNLQMTLTWLCVFDFNVLHIGEI